MSIKFAAQINGETFEEPALFDVAAKAWRGPNTPGRKRWGVAQAMGLSETFVRDIDRGWRTPSRKEFDPGPFDVGAWVTWESKGRTHTGQVWAVAGPRRRWVADGLAYHEVYDDQLVEARAAA